MSGLLASMVGAGQTEGVAFLWSADVTQVSVSPADALASFTMNSDGTTSQAVSGSAPTAGPNWYEPTTPGVGAAFVAFATGVGSPLTSGTLGSELSLSSSRTWSLSFTTVGGGANNLTIEIRRAGQVEGTGLVFLSAEKAP